jgi:hypothetical protein
LRYGAPSIGRSVCGRRVDGTRLPILACWRPIFHGNSILPAQAVRRKKTRPLCVCLCGVCMGVGSFGVHVSSLVRIGCEKWHPGRVAMPHQVGHDPRPEPWTLVETMAGSPKSPTKIIPPRGCACWHHASRGSPNVLPYRIRAKRVNVGCGLV